MIYSNIFLVLPPAFAVMYHEWIYFLFAAGICIFSPLYHWYKIHKKKSLPYIIFRDLDIVFTVGGILYMYYFSYTFSPPQYQLLLFGLLTGLVIFFLYGRSTDYKKFHPWFHIAGAVISSLILVLTH